MTWSIGKIGTTRIFVSIDKLPCKSPNYIHFGPTYNGTTAGLVARFGRFAILAHYRPLPRLRLAAGYYAIHKRDGYHTVAYYRPAERAFYAGAHDCALHVCNLAFVEAVYNPDTGALIWEA